MSTPKAILFAAGRETIQRLIAEDAQDADSVATVIAAVASEYGVPVDELENEVRDRTEDDYEPDYAGPVDAAEADSIYGRDDPEPTYGPARLHDDGYYARNDAGEYAWM